MKTLRDVKIGETVQVVKLHGAADTWKKNWFWI